jgi:ribosomal 50S subunit-associated protein YjgA (DUF615 family)
MNKEADENKFQKYIDVLIKDLGLENLPAEKQKEVVERITKIAEHRIIQTILLSAREEDVEAVKDKIKNSDDPQQVYIALAGKIEGLDVKIEETLSELYLNLKESLPEKKED